MPGQATGHWRKVNQRVVASVGALWRRRQVLCPHKKLGFKLGLRCRLSHLHLTVDTMRLTNHHLAAVATANSQIYLDGALARHRLRIGGSLYHGRVHFAKNIAGPVVEDTSN